MNYNQLTGEINGERSGFEIKAHDIETYVWPHLRNKKDLVTLLVSAKTVTKLNAFM